MDERSAWFDLAQLLEAGIAPLDAVSRLASDRPGEKSPLVSLRADLERGRSLVVALGRAGFATRLETGILGAAEAAGKLSEAVRLVAKNLDARHSRAARLGLRLWLPNAVAFIALIISAVRATTAGHDPGSAVFGAVVAGVLIVVVTRVLVAGCRADPARWLSVGWRLGLQRSNALFRGYFDLTFYTLFLWQAEAGLDYGTAAKNLGLLIDDASYKRAVSHYRGLVTRGGAVADALATSALLVPGELAETINVGEQSGRLAPALRYYLAMQGARLERTTDTIFTWIPRGYYFFVLLIGAASLL